MGFQVGDDAAGGGAVDIKLLASHGSEQQKSLGFFSLLYLKLSHWRRSSLVHQSMAMATRGNRFYSSHDSGRESQAGGLVSYLFIIMKLLMRTSVPHWGYFQHLMRPNADGSKVFYYILCQQPQRFLLTTATTWNNPCVLALTLVVVSMDGLGRSSYKKSLPHFCPENREKLCYA